MEQVNVKTKEPYQGGNQLTLQGYDYESNKWGTFLTWKELGYSIIKGESGVSCFRITPKKFTKRNLIFYLLVVLKNRKIYHYGLNLLLKLLVKKIT